MSVLFIGGTGLISTAFSEWGLQRGIELIDAGANALWDRIIQFYQRAWPAM